MINKKNYPKIELISGTTQIFFLNKKIIISNLLSKHKPHLIVNTV